MHPCKIGPCSMIEIGKDNSNFYHYTLHKDDTGSHHIFDIIGEHFR